MQQYQGQRQNNQGVPAQLPRLQTNHRTEQTPRTRTRTVASAAASAPRASAPRASAPRASASRAASPAATAAQVGLSQESRDMIRRYIALDDQISKFNGQLSQLRKDRTALKKEVMRIIQPLPAPVKSGNTVLRVKTKIKRETVNQKFWVKALAESGQLIDPGTSKDLVTAIYKNRETAEAYELIRE